MNLIHNILIIIIIFIFTENSYSSEVCDDEHSNEHTRIYYANGMNNNVDDWVYSREQIDDLMGNISQLAPGFSVNHDEKWLKEFLEVYKQKKNEPSLFWRWLGGNIDSEEWFKLEYAKINARIANEELINDADLLRIVEEYLDDLRSGIKVVIVGHSQGNLYANSAIRYIRLHYPQYKNSIGLVSVGTPANRVEGFGPHTTNRLDTVIEGVRLASNYGLIPAPLLATGITFNLIDISGHEFVNTYLRAWGDRIRRHINQTMVRLKVPPKDFECEKPEDVPIKVQTASAKYIESASATLFGNIIEGKQADAWFLKNAGTTVSTCVASAIYFKGKGTFDRGEGMTETIYGLKNGTLYSFRACGKNANGEISSGAVFSFRTKKVLAPTRVSTLAATNINNTTATIRGHVDSGTNIDVWLIALKNSFPSCSQHAASHNGFGSANTGSNYKLNLTGLSPNSNYYYRFCGKGNTGYISNGSILSFKTTNIKNCGSTIQGNAGTYNYRFKIDGTGPVHYDIDMIVNSLIFTGARFIFRSNGNAFIDTGFGIFRRDNWFNFTGVNGPYIDIEVIASGSILWQFRVGCPFQ